MFCQKNYSSIFYTFCFIDILVKNFLKLQKFELFLKKSQNDRHSSSVDRHELRFWLIYTPLQDAAHINHISDTWFPFDIVAVYTKKKLKYSNKNK